MKRIYLIVLVAISTYACRGADPDPSPQSFTADQIEAAANGSAAPRFDLTAVEAMKKQLLAEPKIRDVLFQPAPLAVEWQVAVADDGSSRVGYAGYVCQLLSAKHLVDQDVDVRIVDAARIEEGFRSASLGHVSCDSGADLGI